PGAAPMAAGRPGASVEPVVRSFLRDDHVVDVAFPESRRRDPDETGLPAEGRHVGGAAVAHPGPQAADELRDERGQRALVGDPPLDPLGHELPLVELVLLEVTVAAPLPHRAERSHAAVFLEAAPLVEDRLAG